MATKTKTAVAAKTVAPAAAADSTPTETGLPAGFVSPFKRVEMQPNIRIDDGISCIAMLVNQPLDTIMKAAFQRGVAEHGPSWCYASQLQSILRDYGLNAEEKECSTIDALPDVALITAQYNPATQYGRWVLWHHVRATGKIKSFHYVIDPAYWIDPSRHIVTTDIQQLITPKSPIYYLEITPKQMTAKSKAK
ncbi:hypothetical protein SAMN05518800_1875 [Variovorax sp. YR752]|uniref:hypothetical protein n=1 Tax=Variovorax sp. YR752 TaxID=1884383 RepID=UPI000BDB8156|nr:hypothetical protein [Variovorax sp. YR752]SOD25371.1 hypothetical protein SAMN05518800_1875 [Variovorax sp. YR752]